MNYQKHFRPFCSIRDGAFNKRLAISHWHNILSVPETFFRFNFCQLKMIVAYKLQRPNGIEIDNSGAENGLLKADSLKCFLKGPNAD